jgi:phosphatidate cytidylyltransferase
LAAPSKPSKPSEPGKLIQRILLIFVTFPLIFALLFLLPHHSFLALNLTVVAFTFTAALEVRNLIRRHSIPVSRLLAPLLGATLPAFFYLVVSKRVDAVLAPVWLALVAGAVLTWAALVEKKERLQEVLLRACSSLLVVLYPGLFLSFIVLMSGWEEASYRLLLFFSLVFINDMGAYIAGKLFGKKSNYIISPNKSVAGFAAGFAGSTGMAALFYFVLPSLFSVAFPMVLLLGALIGLTTILGDLVESAFKRSADVKDSGTIMVGRGGVLDSVDSLLFSAPFFYFFFQYILK